MTNHLRFDFNLVKCLAVVDTNDGSNHLGDNDHVSQVCLHNFGLLIWWSLLLSAAQFLHQGHWLTLQTTGKSPTSAGVHELHELLIGHIKELVKIDTSEGKLPEGTLFLESFIDLSHVSDLFDRNLSNGDIADLVFKGIDYDLFDEYDVSYKCNCSYERTGNALLSLSPYELWKMLMEQKTIDVNCHFCHKKYSFNGDDIEKLRKAKEAASKK